MSSWDPSSIDAAVDARMGAVDPPADPAAVTPPAATTPAPATATEAPPVVQPPAEIPQPDPLAAAAAPPPEQPALEQPAADEVDDAAAYRAAVDRIGGLEELDLITTLAAPLMAAKLDPEGFFKAIEDNRGRDAYEQLSWAQWDRNATSYVDDLLNNPQFDVSVIKDPQLRQRVVEFRSGARPAAAAAPTPVVAPTAQPGTPTPHRAESPRPAALPAIDVEDYSLPPEVVTFIEAAQARDAQFTAIETRLNDVDRVLAEDRTRREEAARTQTATVEQERLGSLTSQVTGIIDNLLGPATFSTQVDPALRDQENADTRKEIKGSIIYELDIDPNFDEIYGRVKAAYLTGDRVGPRADLRTLKQMVDEKVKDRITKRGGKLKAAVAAPAVNPNPRVIVSGPGSGAAPNLPTPPAAQNGGRAWENIDSQIDQKMAALRPSPPVG